MLAGAGVAYGAAHGLGPDHCPALASLVAHSRDVARYALAVEGIVQGVGFRPFAYALAQRLGLRGFISNHGAAVRIEVEGAPAALEHFVRHLSTDAPPLADVRTCEIMPMAPVGDTDFRIVESSEGPCASLGIGPDAAVCAACQADVLTPDNRRAAYPFTNCTHCGPRLSIARALPYDRPHTSMATFTLCAACRGEYQDVRDRRFHAQPIACAACGPALSWHNAQGERQPVADALQAAGEALRAGCIVALKGVGGFQLACRADWQGPVSALRHRKARPHKPFALMVRDVQTAHALCHINRSEAALLQSSANPIVLLARRADAAVTEAVAPHTPLLGLLLPTTPLHLLLCRAVGDVPLVMTSGNRQGAALCAHLAEARTMLQGVADGYLDHNRPITLRCDDSVARLVHGAPRVLRRARGYTPRPLPLPSALKQPTVALGGHLKAVFALGLGAQAVLGPHVGDLHDVDCWGFYTEALGHFERLHAMAPTQFVHDLHPDYASTRFAQTRARGQPNGGCLAVQHHHAHMASCMAEHGLHGPTLGVVFDGAGLGHDGTLWGGEFLLGDYAAVQRVAHLRATPLWGGEHAMREPWRMALAHAHLAGADVHTLPRFVRNWPTARAAQLITLMQGSAKALQTTSMGRLFDAVAALVGHPGPITYEGEAAQRLETLALDAPEGSSYKFSLDQQSNTWKLDPVPVIGRVCEDVQRGVPPAVVARSFHQGVCDAVVDVCQRVRAVHDVTQVVLSGGVFMNALLLQSLHTALPRAGFMVYSHQAVPSHDGGLSLGQLAIAAARGG